MFQQHHGESLSEAWTRFKELLQKVPHHGIDLWLQVQIFYNYVNRVIRRPIDQSAGGKLRDRNAIESWELLEDLALYENESWNDPRVFAKPVKAITLPQGDLSTSDRRLIELENQVQRLMEAHLAPMQPTQVNKITTSCKIYSGPHDTQYCMEDPKQAFVEYASLQTDGTRSRHLRTQLEQQQDDMISKINLLWKAVFEKLDDAPLCDTVGGPTTQMNFTYTDHHTKEELRSKEIKIPSKLLFPKYLSQSSIIEQNKNSSSLKRVHFVNSIVILNKENEAKEEGSVEPSKTKYTNRENANETNEEVKSEKEVKEETKGKTKEEDEDNPEHFDTFPAIKELRLEPRRKPSNPKKNCNFVGRVKGLSVFIGNFTYECDFMVLEDTTSVIYHYLGLVVFGKPFTKATGLVYNKDEVTVVFERDKQRIIFKMPHKMDKFKHVDFTDRGTDSIPPFIIESNDDNCEKTHYSHSLDLGLEYRHDEYVCRGIQSLMAAKSRRKNK
uniref:MAK10-like protein n=1 Tax=Tanacetum cinerariifolium TaxID=118510 RepID=A0A6L2NXA9_TANCI|nr:MAK10-like protein [Tanacetum cinerariifolium]